MALNVSTCLWFDNDALAAATRYVSLIPDSAITGTLRNPGGTPSGADGDVLVVHFTLAGQRFQGLNGGPHFTLTEAASIVLDGLSQDESDRIWDALTSDGGQESQCGWLKDRWGLSWQVIPQECVALLSDPEPARARRASDAMMTMRRLDSAAMRAAVEAG